CIYGGAMWYKGFRLVELDVDSVAVVQAIKSSATTSVNGISLIRSICRLLDQVWEVKVAHSYREANSCADALANIGYSFHLNIVYFDECPNQVRHLVSADNRGITSPRLIPLVMMVRESSLPSFHPVGVVIVLSTVDFHHTGNVEGRRRPGLAVGIWAHCYAAGWFVPPSWNALFGCCQMSNCLSRFETLR
ncbi:ribonuclease H, partial [Trifolium pratense]